MQPLLLFFRPRIYRQAACKLARAERYWAAPTATRAIIHPMAGAGEHHPEPGTPLRMIDIVRSGRWLNTAAGYPGGTAEALRLAEWSPGTVLNYRYGNPGHDGMDYYPYLSDDYCATLAVPAHLAQAGTPELNQTRIPVNRI
jgi:hypothetical protein